VNRKQRPMRIVVLASLVMLPGSAALGDDPAWGGMRRGSWIRSGPPQSGDVVLVTEAGARPSILVSAAEPSCVQQAVRFLAGDIEKLAGTKPNVVDKPPSDGPCIQVATAAPGTDPRWEAYSVAIGNGRIVIQGSNRRGTAFGVYELCERLGIDPLYHWTGYTPEETVPLVVKGSKYEQGSPAVRFRGLFHDDEDILPRPKWADGTRRPDIRGTVDRVWYERYFETALRLKMNMVAPYVRTTRRYEIQKMASDWGLYYTSHHYDVLLSDPYSFKRRNLAQVRGVTPEWSWAGNRDGLIRFWKAGLEENKDVECIWPVGLRGENDYGHRFPKDWTQEQKLAAFNEALRIQVDMVNDGLPLGRERLMHFTMYTEMLDYFKTGKLAVPENVIIVWPDDNDGRMRGLPQQLGRHKHGVYYHLAYCGRVSINKQTHQIIPLPRIEEEFRAILKAGANEFCLVNVSELREYVLGTRFIADICWNGPQAFRQPDAATRFLNWWCREYFGEAAGPAAARAYQAYFELMAKADLLGYGASKVLGAVPSLRKKFGGEVFTPAMLETLPTLKKRYAAHAELKAALDQAREAIPTGQARRFFFENLELAAAMDRLHTESAILLVSAMSEPDHERTLALCLRALPPLDELHGLLRQAERWPFDAWYGPTWVKWRNRKLVYPRQELIKLLREFAKPIE
jgi:hypothetical protein